MRRGRSAISWARAQGRIPSKLGNVRTKRDGFTFDSKKEARYYDELVLRYKAGEVAFFLCQVPFRLPGGVTYRVDFVIFETGGTVRFIDVKGFETETFKIKKKIVEATYPVEIEVVK